MNQIHNKKTSAGFGIIELIVAMAIFMLIATAGATTVIQGFNVNRLGEEEGFANLYAQEGIEAVRSIKNRDWNNLTAGTFGLSTTGNEWNFSGSYDTNDKYTRQITIEQGQRDGGGNIVDSVGTVDSDLFKVTAKVTWNFSPTRSNSVELITYLAQWEKSIIAGVYRISYYDETNKDLKYAECSTDCTVGGNWIAVTVDATGDVGQYASMDIEGTTVGIAYFDETNKDLKYAECSTACNVSTNWIAVTVDATGDVGEYSSFVSESGVKRISYYFKDSLDLKYAECSSDCSVSTNWTTVTVDAAGDTGQFTSIASDGSKVGIAYYDLSNKDLKYAECSANCANTGNWSTATVDFQREPGKHASLVLSSGNPRISYYEESKKDLKYAECNTNCTSSANWVKVVVEAAGETGWYTSIAIDSGNPRISYFRPSGNRLKYAQCNSNCTSSSNWSSGEITTAGNMGGQFSSLAFESGKPRVSYYNDKTKDLQFGSCDSNCTSSSSWTRITIQSLGDVGQYTSLKIK